MVIFFESPAVSTTTGREVTVKLKNKEQISRVAQDQASSTQDISRAIHDREPVAKEPVNVTAGLIN